jgi:Zn-dependent protease with chaperone function
MATDFFDQQEHARRQTGRLVVLFVLAVVGIIAAVYAAATVAMLAATRHGQPPWLDGPRLGVVVTTVLLVIATGSLFKIAMLRDGGEAIASMLGGHPLDPARASLPERRLLNVVEEMALASGTPVPPVFVLDNEPGINAFAAGFTPGDAVIGVSRGALEHLTRDELQGVIGHEFSHILNGDMRLNLRLIGLIHGILVLALIGQLVIRGVLQGSSRSSRGRGDGKDSGLAIVVMLVVLGAALWIIGLIGVLFGRIIKCAISREREFLADASSVQFTRNPDGLAGALKKIGGLTAGSRIENRHAEEACHMFFGQGVASLSNLFATHPPLEDRIRRLDPSFDGIFAHVSDRAVAVVDDDRDKPLAAGLSDRPRRASRPDLGEHPGEFPLDATAAVASVGKPTQAHVDYASVLIGSLPPELAVATRVPFSARAIVFALLLDADEAVRKAQLDHLEASSEKGTVPEVLRLAPLIGQLGEPDRIPLVDLTFPALRQLSERQYRAFRTSVDSLVWADRRVSLFEYALQRMLLRHLDRTFFRLSPPSVRYHSLDAVFNDCDVLVSSLARLGRQQGTEEAQAYELGMRRLQGREPGERVVALLPAERCSLSAVDKALDRLAQAAPGIKRRVLDACAACIASDGVVTLPEGELLRAISDSLDCPMPPLLARPAGAPAPIEAGRRGG